MPSFDGTRFAGPDLPPPSRHGEPVLITDAPLSYEEQLAARKKRYFLMMGMRIPCLIAAAAFYQIPWLAVSLLALSVPLPWMAVLIANDGPPRDTKRRRPLEGTISYERAIEPMTHVIDADPDVVEQGAADTGFAGQPDGDRPRNRN